MSRLHGWYPKPKFTCGLNVEQEDWDRIFNKPILRPIWWCNTHKREATHIDKNGNHRCDPNLGGILMPCNVDLNPEKFD